MAINSDFAALCPAVTATYIRSILAPVGTKLTDAQIETRINIAWAQVNAISSELGDCGGAATFCEIAALVAAHIVTISERQTKRESVAGEWTVEYMGKSDGAGLRSSLYGQQAIALDCSGILAEIADGVKRTGFKVYSQYDIDDVILT